jgi:hypothetical protein
VAFGPAQLHGLGNLGLQAYGGSRGSVPTVAPVLPGSNPVDQR